jgi:hypothetical protein
MTPSGGMTPTAPAAAGDDELSARSAVFELLDRLANLREERDISEGGTSLAATQVLLDLEQHMDAHPLELN